MNPFSAIWYWRLSIIRCVLYGGVVSWGVFKAGTNGFDGLDQMTPLQKVDLTGDMAAAFGGVLLAFLDNSISRITNGVNPNPNKTDMKKLTAGTAAIAAILFLFVACNTTQQRIAANTISSLDITTTAAVDNYYAATIKGLAPTNGIPTVSKAYNQFHKDEIIAIDLAQNNTNALAPDNLTQEAADVLSAVAAIFPPAVPKNNIPNNKAKIQPIP
jgi:hypothetical protein